MKGGENIESVILVGHSYGSLLSLIYKHLYPSQVYGLVLIDPITDTIFEHENDWVAYNGRLSGNISIFCIYSDHYPYSF